ncbi:hypothetical protein B0T26DRAFT_746903 [Lasiosphaeria miniovina]|uniref:Uncharacterized protein n=1 Tax=Lasiosphaeria miniovina TaxID=1954250 RepID=A0AA40EB60_9PEZI|nr:uncharacterized protein B0T26DRAFT_746903 [Lasiosphaeria miniovina]KAK0735079.1 hypothetical protein B0T26DRAFT_746903 [Lasiosphaeria miniovina]
MRVASVPLVATIGFELAKANIYKLLDFLATVREMLRRLEVMELVADEGGKTVVTNKGRAAALAHDTLGCKLNAACLAAAALTDHGLTHTAACLLIKLAAIAAFSVAANTASEELLEESDDAARRCGPLRQHPERLLGRAHTFRHANGALLLNHSTCLTFWNALLTLEEMHGRKFVRETRPDPLSADEIDAIQLHLLIAYSDSLGIVQRDLSRRSRLSEISMAEEQQAAALTLEALLERVSSDPSEEDSDVWLCFSSAALAATAPRLLDPLHTSNRPRHVSGDEDGERALSRGNGRTERSDNRQWSNSLVLRSRAAELNLIRVPRNALAVGSNPAGPSLAVSAQQDVPQEAPKRLSDIVGKKGVAPAVDAPGAAPEPVVPLGLAANLPAGPLGNIVCSYCGTVGHNMEMCMEI